MGINCLKVKLEVGSCPRGETTKKGETIDKTTLKKRENCGETRPANGLGGRIPTEGVTTSKGDPKS